MSKIKSFESIKSKYTKIYDERNELIKDYLTKVENAKKRLDEASEKAEAAYKDADMEAYHKWQNEIRYNNDAISMYQSKADRLKEDPIITRKEFDEIYRDLKIYFEDFIEHDRETLANIVRQMIVIRDREEGEVDKANEFLKFAQLELLKATHGLWRDGMLETTNIKQLDNYEGLTFVNFVCRHNFVEKYFTDKQPKGVRSWTR